MANAKKATKPKTKPAKRLRGKAGAVARFGSVTAAKTWGSYCGLLNRKCFTKAVKAKAKQIRVERGVKRAIGFLRGVAKKAEKSA